MSANQIAYLDTSVVAKWYLNEAQSDKVSAYITALDSAVISELTKIEMRCLLARRKRSQDIDHQLETQIYATFLNDIDQGYLSLYPVNNEYFEYAINLIDTLPKHSLRTLDALHLAIAQHLPINQLATADADFAKAAQALNIKVDFF